jgi:hypothetical protein
MEEDDIVFVDDLFPEVFFRDFCFSIKAEYA